MLSYVARREHDPAPITTTPRQASHYDTLWGLDNIHFGYFAHLETKQAQLPQPKPFDTIEGGGNSVSDILWTKTVLHARRVAQPSLHALFWRQNTVWDTFGPRL